MKRGEKMSLNQRLKISEGVKLQHAEGRGVYVGFTKEARQKGVDRNWKGDKASKAAIHAWVRRKKGMPRKCEHCGTKSARKYEWANKDHSYRRTLDDYMCLCTSCHRKYDIANNNYRQ